MKIYLLFLFFIISTIVISTFFSEYLFLIVILNISILLLLLRFFSNSEKYKLKNIFLNKELKKNNQTLKNQVKIEKNIASTLANMLKDVDDLNTIHSEYDMLQSFISKLEKNPLFNYVLVNTEDKYIFNDNKITPNHVRIDLESIFEHIIDLDGTQIEKEGFVFCNSFDKTDRYNKYINVVIANNINSFFICRFSNPFDINKNSSVAIYSEKLDIFNHEFSLMLFSIIKNFSHELNMLYTHLNISEKLIHKNNSYKNLLYSLSSLIEERDIFNIGHTDRVSEYAQLLGKALGLSQEALDRLYEASKLHDIGKITTPDDILLKPGKLTKKEYDLVKEHVNVGADILLNANFSDEIIDIVKYHHEEFNGEGYPFGLKGEAIPICARILHVADSFDGMTTNRIYKPKKSINEAILELNSLSNTTFDPEIINVANIVFPNIILETTNNHINDFTTRDSLTNLNNIHHLTHIFNSDAKHLVYRSLVLITVTNLEDASKLIGWEEGNKVLIKIAAHLQKVYRESLIFRIFKGQYVLLTKEPIAFDKEYLVNTLKQYVNFEIIFDIRNFNLEKQEELDQFKAILNAG